MLNDGDRYVINSSDTLYRIANSSCSEGSQVNINNTTVERFRFINGKWHAQDTYNINNYGSATYVCHVYSSLSNFTNPESVILPATLVVLVLFSVIFHWFLRLRG